MFKVVHFERLNLRVKLERMNECRERDGWEEMKIVMEFS